ncbi:hypothetical protein FKM82_026654 [Ascaphus truei]
MHSFLKHHPYCTSNLCHVHLPTLPSQCLYTNAGCPTPTVPSIINLCTTCLKHSNPVHRTLDPTMYQNMYPAPQYNVPANTTSHSMFPADSLLCSLIQCHVSHSPFYSVHPNSPCPALLHFWPLPFQPSPVSPPCAIHPVSSATRPLAPCIYTAAQSSMCFEH